MFYFKKGIPTCYESLPPHDKINFNPLEFNLQIIDSH